MALREAAIAPAVDIQSRNKVPISVIIGLVSMEAAIQTAMPTTGSRIAPGSSMSDGCIFSIQVSGKSVSIMCRARLREPAFTKKNLCMQNFETRASFSLTHVASGHEHVILAIPNRDGINSSLCHSMQR